MGTPNMQPKSVAWWPKDEALWPLDPSTKERLLRFRWNENWRHKDNWAGISKVKSFIKAHGVTRLPEAAQAVREISDKDLEDRIVLKFKDTVKALKEAKLYVSEGVSSAVSAARPERLHVESGTEVEPVSVVVGLSKAQIQSRAKGVSLVQLHDGLVLVTHLWAEM